MRIVRRLGDAGVMALMHASFMPKLPNTRYSLLARLAEPGDAAAWAEVVEIYEEAVYRYSRSRGLQDADAWDAVQQVLVTLHQKIGQWRPNGRPGAFRAWLLRTAHRVCLRAFRELARQDRAAGGAGDEPLRYLAAADAEDDSDRDWEKWAFCWAAGMVECDVEPGTWRAFWLTAVEGKPAPEVAKRLQMRIGNVYTARCRVLARIRELVSELSRNDL